MGTNSAVSATPEYRPNKPNFALAIPLDLIYKNPGENQHARKTLSNWKRAQGSSVVK